MFYCEACRINNNWPTSFGRSHGKCEICNIVGECYDRPSSSLPDSPQETPQKEKWSFDPAEIAVNTYQLPPVSGCIAVPVVAGVRIVHMPSGLDATCHGERSLHKNRAEAMRLLSMKVQEWKDGAKPVKDPHDPFPGKTDAELGFAYRMMVRAHRGGLVVNFATGDISIPTKKR